MSQMYAWANTVQALINFGSEHTWVTTYDPGTGSPNETLGHYWYCWGKERTHARNLVIGKGGVDFALKIAKPNKKDESVGIEYGIDGVCHQMANRLLRFSLDENNMPVTVHQAKGYLLSKMMYGEYGGSKDEKVLAKWNTLVSNYQKSIDGDKNV
ncbi:hypothetical protein ACO0LF_14405 [Undibacterium sp. Di27W]|uniref:hypothetical protein n=1 Tax=Undibacterium sp. Di27W TaxID=3413036 RepID=UPI003BF3291E